MKKKILTGLTALSLSLAIAIPAMATTVYYNDDPISWDYGRSWGVWSYSNVQTSRYEHLAVANTTSSGWKAASVKASAKELVGTGTATAFWDCR